MDNSSLNTLAHTEANIQSAISALEKNEFTSIRKAARAFNVPNTTLRNRMSRRTLRSNAHKSDQILSNAKERTLVRWITHLISTGFPTLPALVIQIAKEIRRGRI